MRKKFGFDLLAEQASEYVAARMAALGAGWAQVPFTGDTPIEKLFYLSLYAHTQFGDGEWPWSIEVGPGEKLERLKTEPGYEHKLLLQRQAEIAGVGRVDFLIQAYGDWARAPSPRPAEWRRLIVECDGHDFHERTKDQAAKDRGRDRAAQMLDLEVFRFTGSELWRDPWRCGAQVIAWANRGV